MKEILIEQKRENKANTDGLKERKIQYRKVKEREKEIKEREKGVLTE